MTLTELNVLNCHQERFTFHFARLPRLIFYFLIQLFLFGVCSLHDELVNLALVIFFKLFDMVFQREVKVEVLTVVDSRVREQLLQECYETRLAVDQFINILLCLLMTTVYGG